MIENAPNYEQAIDRTPLLTHDEEALLASIIRAGRQPGATDLRKRRAALAEARWIEGNLRLVLSIVNRMREQYGSLDRDDLIQEGNLGLIHALELFDFDRGLKFSTYAVIWIRKYVQRAIENTSRTVRLPVNAEAEVRAIHRVREDLTTLLERPPTDDEVADEVGIAVDRVRLLQVAAQAPLSLNTEDDGARDVPEPETGPTITDMVDGLDENGQRLMLLRYGSGLSQAAAADQIGVSVSTAIRREREALKQLREAA